MLVALWARVVWHEPVRPRLWAALVLALLGLALVTRLWLGLTLDAVGVLGGLGASVSLAVYLLAGNLAARTSPVWALALWMVLAGTIAPFILILSALRHLPATRVGVVAMAEPMVATLIAWLWLGEALGIAQLAGGLLVACRHRPGPDRRPTPAAPAHGRTLTPGPSCQGA